ncbi:MAG TPA: solute carrier family 23 protein [Candidatus Saccharimonadales bacterium]
MDKIKTEFRRRMPDLVGYTKQKLMRDLGAGITVGIVALPLSLALAIATGVPPILGLYTAGIAGFLAALFSGSAYSVSGPAAAMVPILAAIIQNYGLQQIPYITILAALMLITFALIGLGRYIHKVPESVILGFTAGVAIVILFGQLNNFLGLNGLEPHKHFAENAWETITHLMSISLPVAIVGVLALLIILYAPKLKAITKVPPTLIAVVVATLLVMFVPMFAGVPTLGSQFGALPLGFPSLNLGAFSLEHLLNRDLWFPAFQVAALIAIESLLCAVVADRLTKTKHRSNQELAAQGVANLGSAVFGGIPATAVIARTGTIIKAGAASRLASMLHAAIVIAFIVALAPIAVNIPLSALSAVLIITAVRISEYKEVAHFVRHKNWRLASVLMTTLVLTVFTDLVIGVSAGLILHLAYRAHGQLRGRNRSDRLGESIASA